MPGTEWLLPSTGSTLPGLFDSYTLKERTMQKRRAGFTLIELLIVIVIIGILAAIAIPKFGKTREKAYFKAIMSDLRNLNNQEEIYYSNPASGYSYTEDITDLPEFQTSQGVTITGIESDLGLGWVATATHAALDPAAQWCGLYVGNSTGLTAGTLTGYSTNPLPGVVACTGEQ
jgi:prepilin-type N-terminal cleavage/methylation domain-containing protein